MLKDATREGRGGWVGWEGVSNARERRAPPWRCPEQVAHGEVLKQ